MPTCLSAASTTGLGATGSAGRGADASVLQLDGPSSLEGVHVAIGGKAKGIPKSHRRLNAQLSLQGEATLPCHKGRDWQDVTPC